MSERCCDTLLATIVECDDAAVAQGQLNLTLTLLAGNLTCYRAVDLIGEPVFTSDGLQLKHAVEVFINLILAVGYVGIVALDGLVAHDGLG